MLSSKRSHSSGAPEIVEHEEAAAQQILAERLGLGVGQFPVAHFAGCKPGPIVDIVADRRD